MEFIGDLSHISEETKFEWKIKAFLQLNDKPNTWYESKKFLFLGKTWQIWIYPNGDTNDRTVGFIDLRIGPISSIKPTLVNYSLHLKTLEGKADAQTERKGTEFIESGKRFRCFKFISRSELLERKSELLPSGILTIICILKKRDTDSVAGVWNLQDQFKEILVNGNFSDVVLKVNGKEFKSHRCVLAARSPVFLAMLMHETKEKNTGVVDIQDVDSSTFSDFLLFLYTGSDEIITPVSVVNLFTAADKYQVDDLRKSCLYYMLNNISVDNFCEILSLSLVHAEKDLTDACSQFFVEKSLLIVKNRKWQEFRRMNPVVADELEMKVGKIKKLKV